MKAVEITRPLTSLLTPVYRGIPKESQQASGSTAATKILDYHTQPIVDLVREAASGSHDELATLRAAHALTVARVKPVYALNERQRASITLVRGEGSCSQRLAILEAVARGLGIQTRVRALVIDRSFWLARFPHLYPLLPDRMRLAWPEFLLDGAYSGASELFGSIGCQTGGGFKNFGSETLFEAAGRCAVDWDGVSHDERYDLSRYVLADAGTYASRDEMFDAIGETLNPLALAMLNPVLSRIRA